MGYAAPAQGAGHSHIHRHKHEVGCSKGPADKEYSSERLCSKLFVCLSACLYLKSCLHACS